MLDGLTHMFGGWWVNGSDGAMSLYQVAGWLACVFTHGDWAPKTPKAEAPMFNGILSLCMYHVFQYPIGHAVLSDF